MSDKKTTILDLQTMKREGRPITMLTAYDYPSALLVARAGIDAILVGDSLAMTMLGLKDTLPVTMDMMLHHCAAVARAATSPLLIGDMPFMSYQVDTGEAVRNAGRFLQQGNMDTVKLEGGQSVANTVAAIVAAGIPVMGHIGLTPQSVSALGGYRVQGRLASEALRLFQDARALQEAGCYAVVLEAVPAPVATAISRRIDIPTIGIGAGGGCDGQVLVYHDLLGMFERFQPKFVRQYAQLNETILDALQAFRDDVVERRFPTEEHAYSMDQEELDRFLAFLEAADQD